MLARIMVWTRILFFLLPVSLIACAHQDYPAAHPLDDFVEIFPGRYDSYAQTQNDIRLGLDEDQRNYRRHSIFRKVDHPAFGETVFLAHQYRDGDPMAVYRQRLYTLTPQGEGFTLRVHVPKSKDALKFAYQDPSVLNSLRPEDFIVWDGCDLFWQLEEGVFVGRLEPGACRFDSEAFGQTIVLEETLTLSPSRITFADGGRSLSGGWLFGMRGDTPNISLKVRPFLCGYDGQTAWLHDQGRRSNAFGFEVLLARDETLTLTAQLKGRIETEVSADRNATLITLQVQDKPLTCRYAPETIYSEER